MEIDHEIFCMVILSLLLIQKGQFSVSGKRKCTILFNQVEYKTCLVNVWLHVGKLTAHDMIPLGSAQTNYTFRLKKGPYLEL